MSDKPNLDGGMEAKEGTFPQKLRSNAAYLMSFHNCLTQPEAKVICDKLEKAADLLESASAGPSREAIADAAWTFRETLVPRADAMLDGKFPAWHGWAIYEAFEAGAAFAKSGATNSTDNQEAK